MNYLNKNKRVESIYKAAPDYIRSDKSAITTIEKWVDAGLDDATILKIFDNLSPMLPLNLISEYSFYLDVIKPTEIKTMETILLLWHGDIVRLTPAHFSIVYHANKKFHNIDAATEFLLQLKSLNIYDLSNDLELLYAESLKSC